MSDSGRPPSWTVRLLRGSAYLFGTVVLLHLTLALLREIWWLFVIVAIVVTGIVAFRWWYRIRDRWNQ